MTTPDPFSPEAASNYDATPVNEPTDGGPVAGAPVPGAPVPGAPTYGAPAPAAPMYPPPGYAAYPPAPTNGGTDGVSIAALVAGVLGTGVVALVLGIVGLRRTRGGVRAGRGMALAGVILGALGTIVWTVAIIGVIAFFANLDGGVTPAPDPMWDINQTESGYGSDPHLDMLWDECDAGDMAACDDLFLESPWGSEYEEFADNCGTQGRPVFQIYCDAGTGE